GRGGWGGAAGGDASARHAEAGRLLPRAHPARRGLHLHVGARGHVELLDHLDDVALRVALVEVVLGELDEAARAEQPAPEVGSEEVLDDATDEIAHGVDRIVSLHGGPLCSFEMEAIAPDAGGPRRRPRHPREPKGRQPYDSTPGITPSPISGAGRPLQLDL